MAATEELKFKVSADVAGAVNGMKQVNTELAKTSTTVKKSGKDFTNLGRVIQDLPFGFTGIQNNLTQLIPAVGGVGLAFSALVAGITFAQTGFSNWTRGLGGASDATKKVKKDTDELAKSIHSIAAETASRDIAGIQTLAAALTDLNIPLKTRTKAIEDYNKVADKQNQLSVEDLNNIGKINTAVNSQIALYTKRSLVRAAEEKLKDLYKTIFDEEEKMRKSLQASGKLNVGDVVRNLTDAQKASLPTLRGTGKEYNNVVAGLEDMQVATGLVSEEFADAEQKIGLSARGFQNNITSAKKEIASLFLFIQQQAKAGDVFGSVFEGNDDKDAKLKKAAKEKADKFFAEYRRSIPRVLGDIVFEARLEAKIQEEKDTTKEKLLKKAFPDKVKPINFGFPIKLNPEIYEPAVLAGELRDKINEALKGASISGLSGIGESIGTAIAAGADPIKAAGASIIGTIADLISQIGKALIEYGIVKEGLDKILVSGILIPGAAAIAAGVAAVAVGALLKNSFKPHATGGVIPPGFPNDSYYARLTSGERVLTPSQNKEWEKRNVGRAAMPSFPAYLPSHRISGNDLLLWYQRANTAGGRTS